jgi:hypothetical protein
MSTTIKTNTQAISNKIILGAPATVKSNLIAESIFFIADNAKHEKIIFNPEFKFKSATGEQFTATDEDSLRKWSIKHSDLGPIWTALGAKFSKNEKKKLILPGKRSYAQVLQEGSSTLEIQIPKKTKITSPEAAADGAGKTPSELAGNEELSDFSEAAANKKKIPSYLRVLCGRKLLRNLLRVWNL